ncbi:MAG: ATP-binding cassette domain-containing protein [Spirochaetales bacterium]|nr:MAG: ATP-binding cassette domain-containing protein [Spirochaetales bacterium]
MTGPLSPDLQPLIVCTGVTRRYLDGETEVSAVDDFSATFHRGQFSAITGPSGSGKTTLLNLISAVDYSDDGSVVIGERDLGSLGSAEQAEARATTVSVVFSEHNLLPMMSLYENLSLSLSLLRLPEAETDRRIKAALDAVGIVDLIHRAPGRISSGQRARASLARAIAMNTPALVADEPTAHLDQDTAAEVGALLRDLAETRGVCVVIATHDRTVASLAHQIIRLKDGRQDP